MFLIELAQGLSRFLRLARSPKVLCHFGANLRPQRVRYAELLVISTRIYSGEHHEQGLAHVQGGTWFALGEAKPCQ